jgi:hypothetical protein
MRPLLGVQPDEEEGSVVLLTPELERLDVLERVDVVLLGKVDRFRSLQHSLMMQRLKARVREQEEERLGVRWSCELQEGEASRGS